MSKPKPLLLETIKIEDGKIYNLSYHQKRCTKSRQILFNSQDNLVLGTHIKAPSKGLYRCRILYTTHIHSIEYIPYKEKEISLLKIISSSIEYPFKYANRDGLNHLLSTENNVDEIIIEKEGYLTDTTISNIAFFDGQHWITPAKPLLEGTMRAKLIDEGFLRIADIKQANLENYTQVALMNAMIGFKILKNVHIQDLKGNTHDY
jgi:4-amino-4-deoxychorismate lyase